MPEGSPSPLLRCVPSASRHAKQLWLAFCSDTLRMYTLAVSVDSTGAAYATKRDFLMTSSLVTSRWSVVMPAGPAVVRTRLLPARVRLKRRMCARLGRERKLRLQGCKSRTKSRSYRCVSVNRHAPHTCTRSHHRVGIRDPHLDRVFATHRSLAQQ